MDNNNKWDELSLTEKSEIMKQAVANGITDLNEIRQTYNEYADGGSMDEPENNSAETIKYSNRNKTDNNNIDPNYNAPDYNDPLEPTLGEIIDYTSKYGFKKAEAHFAPIIYPDSELDWSPESWFKLRTPKPDGTYYNAEEAAALASHIPEYKMIEGDAKAFGYWLQMPDGSTWKGDPRAWVMMQSRAFKKNYSDRPWYTGQAEWPTTFDYGNGKIATNKVLRAPYYNGQMWFSDSKEYGDTFANFMDSKGVDARQRLPNERNIQGKNFLAAIPKKAKYRILKSPEVGTYDYWTAMPFKKTKNSIKRIPTKTSAPNPSMNNWRKNERLDNKTVLTDDVVNWSKDLGDQGVFLQNVDDGPILGRSKKGTAHYEDGNPVILPIKHYPVNEFISQPGFTDKVKFIEGNTGDFDINNPYKYAYNSENSNDFTIPFVAAKGGRITGHKHAGGGKMYDDGGVTSSNGQYHVNPADYWAVLGSAESNRPVEVTLPDVTVKAADPKNYRSSYDPNGFMDFMNAVTLGIGNKKNKYSFMDKLKMSMMNTIPLIPDPTTFNAPFDNVTGNVNDRTSSVAQVSYLLPRDKQQKLFEDYGYKRVYNDYGTVKRAAESKGYPIYQKNSDDASRENLVPIGNADSDPFEVETTYKGKLMEVPTNWYAAPNKSLIEAGATRSTIYYNPNNGKYYQKAWDLNDYGGNGGSTADIFGKFLDTIGNPVVVTSGIQEVLPENINKVEKNYMLPYAKKHYLKKADNGHWGHVAPDVIIYGHKHAEGGFGDGGPLDNTLNEVTDNQHIFKDGGVVSSDKKRRKGMMSPTRAPLVKRFWETDEEFKERTSGMTQEEIANYNKEADKEYADMAKHTAEERAQALSEAKKNGTYPKPTIVEKIGEASRKMHQSAEKSTSFDELRRVTTGLENGVKKQVATANDVAKSAQNYANEQAEKKQQQMRDIKKGFDAAATLGEWGAAGYTIGRMTVPRLLSNNTGVMGKLADFFTNSNAQLGANAIGSLADGYQLLTADNKFDKYENGIELGGDTAGVIGGLDIVRNSNIFGRYSKPIDTALDVIGLSAASWDILKNIPPFKYYYGKLKDYVNGTNETEDANQYSSGGKVAHDARYNHVTQIYQSYINQGVNPQAALELTNQKIAEKGWTGWVSGDNKRYGDVNSFTDHTIDQFNRLYPDSLKSNNFNQFFQGIEGGRTKYNPAPNIYRQHLLQTRPGVKKRINEYRRLQGQSPLSLVSPTSTPLPWEESILYNPQLPLEVSTEQPVIAADGGYLFKGGGYIPSASIKRDIANFEGSSMKTNRSFEAEAKDFNKVIPLAIRNKLSQKQLDALYSYGYNVGMGNLKNRVLPTLTAYTQGKAGADDVAASMWASKDIYMRGLRRRRTYERNMFTGNSPVGTRESIVSRAINMDLSGLPTVVKFSGDTPKFQYDLFPPNPTNYGTPIDWSTPEKKVETPTIIPKEDNNGLGLLALINQIYDSPKQEPLATYTPKRNNSMFVVSAPTSNDTFLDSSWFKKGGYLYGDMPQYFPDGGKLANTDPSSSEYQDLMLFKNPLVKLIDPTGISSWKDVKESYEKEGLSANTLWQVAGAIPLVGKLKCLGRAVNFGQFISDVAEDYKKISDISRRSGNTLLVSPNGEFKLRDYAPADAERIGGWKPASAEQIKQYNQSLVNDTEFGYGEYDPADPPLGLITDYAKKYGKAKAKEHFALDNK